MKTRQLFLVVFTIIQLIVIVFVFLYLGGYRKFGSPAEFKKRQQENIQAYLDSVASIEKNRLLPENVADSTLFGVGRHTDVFEHMQDTEQQLETIQSKLDSLERTKTVLEEKEKTLDTKLQNLQEKSALSEEVNIRKLAKIYDNMKPAQAVPLFISMNDSIAVAIISQMSQRNASKLLGVLAEKDIDKASRLNTMLAQLGN